jgi:prepilin-type N-terminal cleavage/methylation domain-containing protein
MSTTEIRGSTAGTRRGNAGFTLLEVLVALFVLAFAFVSLLGLQARNIKVIADDRSYTNATLLGRSLATQFEVQATREGIDSLSSRSAPLDGYPGYRYELEVQDTELENVKRLVIRVIWDERNANGAELLYFIRGPSS